METKITDAKTDQDDWKVAFDHVATFNVPGFIRLFVINRIIAAYLTRTNWQARNSNDTLHSLVAEFELKDTQSSKIAYKILLLLSKNGINKYMKKFYKEKEQAAVIELIFEKIILTKFGKEYQQLTTYYTNHNSNDKFNEPYCCQCKVFNNDDLMCLIFDHLTFKRGFIGQLYDCSLVHTCWLYHVWNTRLIYGKYNLSYFIAATKKLQSDVEGS